MINDWVVFTADNDYAKAMFIVNQLPMLVDKEVERRKELKKETP